MGSKQIPLDPLCRGQAKSLVSACHHARSSQRDGSLNVLSRGSTSEDVDLRGRTDVSEELRLFCWGISVKIALIHSHSTVLVT